MVEDQRRRIAAALCRAVALRGYENTSVIDIIEPAGVSRRTFYDFYRGKADAFRAVHGEALTQVGSEVDRACESEREWSQGVGAAIAAALRWAAAEPDRARLLVGERLTAGPRPGYCHDLLVDRFAPHLRRLRAYAQTRPAAGLEELIVSGLATVVATHLRTGRSTELPGLTADCTQLVLALYRGGA